jgi:hypothetical protein
VKHLLLFLHLFGFVLWLGGGVSAMNLGIAMRRVARTELALMVQLQARVFRSQILPGAMLVVITGLLLTLQLYGSETATAGFPVPLMVMQGAGLLGAALVLVVMLPTSARLGRLDPVGAQAPLFDQLRKRIALAGSLAGLLALIALIGGVLLR